MSGTPGQIGPYTIDRELGRGGMGVVFLGHDTRLDRKVAIKALPEHLAQDPERLARFEREAKTLAQLNHPNVAGIHGVEEHDGHRYLVLEYVEGETLAERLDRGPMPIDEALEIAVQIAAGVEAAHEAGVIHRDLKPGNIIVTPDGRAKVLDFGLARIDEGGSSSGSSMSPTLTTPAGSPTVPGVILGTAAYMSPEQARGRRVDKRADIWSFGVILYEMLTGASPFIGETVTDSLGAILHKDVDLNRLPPATPALVRHVLARCLARDKALRYRDIGDVRVEVEAALRDPGGASLQIAGAAIAGAGGSGSSRIAWALCALVALAASALVWVAWSASRTRPEPVRRFVTDLHREADLASNAQGAPFAISPDGRTLAFLASTADRGRALYVRRLDDLRAVARDGADGAWHPFFSPDGAWIGYYADGRIMKIATDGGAPVTVCDAPPGGGGFRGATWTDDGRIVFAPHINAGLYIVSAEGGEPTPLTTLGADERSHRWPHALPGSNAILFTVQDAGSSLENATIEAVRLDGGDRVVIHRGGSYPLYARSGHLLYGRSEGVFGAPFDAAALRMKAPPTPVIERVAFSSDAGAMSVAVSADGVLLCALGEIRGVRRFLNWADRSGMRTPVGVEPEIISSASLSPDGTRIALQILRTEQGGWDLWIYELARGAMTRLTFGGGDHRNPIWSPDGAEIAFQAAPRGEFPMLTIIGADGTAQRAIGDNQQWESPTDWLEDGTIIFNRIDPINALDVRMQTLDERPVRSTPVVTTPFGDGNGAVSPDRRWIAYNSDGSGRGEVFIRPFPDGAGRWQVSIDGGVHPLWSPDGSELFFLQRGRLFAVPVSTAGDAPELGVPAPLFEFRPGAGGYPVFAVHPDGDRFLLVEADPAASDENQIELTVTINWFEELRERTGG